MKAIRSDFFQRPALFLALMVIAITAQAQYVLYDNGTMQVGDNAWAITGPLSVSNSFTLSGSAAIQVINVGLTAQENLTIGGLAWTFGTTKFGGELRGATVASPSLVLLATEGGYNYYMSTIVIDNPVHIPDAGTYWLTLSDAYLTDDPDNEVYWVQSNGTSVAWQVEGSDAPEQLPASQSFAIIGVPEPTTAILFLGGMAAFAFQRQRRKRETSVQNF